jgi:hypothetical protein
MSQNRMAAALLALAVFLAGCSIGVDRILLRGGTEHLLLLNNRVMKYQEREGAKIKPYTMTMLYAGGVSVRVFETRFKGVDFGECKFISRGPQVFFSTSRPLTAVREVPDCRQLWVNEEAKEGESWEDDDTGTQTMFAGYESVTVPAGTYDRCYKTVTTVVPALAESLKVWHNSGVLTDRQFEQQEVIAKMTIVRWFASGVGLVKEQLGESDHVRELVAVEQPGVGSLDSLITKQDTTYLYQESK